MKKLILIISLVIVVICSFVLMSNISIDKTSYVPVKKEVIAQPLRTGGSPGGYTGSPGDGADCKDCHDDNGTNYNLTPTITTNIPVTGYAFGQTYLITVAATSTQSQHGFELTAEKAGGTIVGVFDLTGATGSPELIDNIPTRVTHSNKDNSSWSFNWTAPSSDEGDITFYAAVLAASGSGSSNDETKLTSDTVTVSTLGIAEANLLAFEIFPNPSQDFLTIQLPDEITNGSLEVFDYSGRSVKSKKINNIDNKLNLSNLAQGVYLMKINSEGKTGVRKFIKI